MAKVNYGKTALKSVKQFRLNLKFLENDIRKDVRREIQRVFHAANRRIENIEKSGVYSPAYQALKGGFDDRQNLTKFAKFSMAGMSDAEIKIQYAQAIAFLQKPTSTASGARTYEQHVKKELDLTDWQFDAIKARLLDNSMTDAENKFTKAIFDKYKDITTGFERAVKDVSEQMESEAAQVLRTVEDTQSDIEKIDKSITNILDGFKRFGF